MPIPSDDARKLIEQLEAADFANYVAQAEARHVLMEVGEAVESFPPFTAGLDNKVGGIAYTYLAAGCSLAEQGARGEGSTALERAARLLRNVHGPHAKESRESAFHLLLAAMAAYAAGQYSWAFVMLRSVPPVTDAVRVIAAFLRRDRKVLQETIARVLFGPATGADGDAADDGTNAAVARSVARTVALAAEFTYTGERKNLDLARTELSDAATIAAETSSPAWWWIARLLDLMLADLDAASPWTLLPPHFGAPGGGPPPDMLAQYVRLLAFDDARPVYELWRSQRDSIPHALGPNPGAVISLRTSGGKTRVAELAILQALGAAPGAKVLFLAPFRSLAFEMEQTLSHTFRPLGYEVSHLYGGTRASRADSDRAAEAQVIVATPEKARALFRAAPDVFADIRLIVIDEGHLLGPGSRDVRNELYYEHLRVRARQTGARVLLLSAALPNADQIAAWIAADKAHLGKSNWRPSLQRYGLLRWNGARVKLDWKGDFESFNPSFIVAKPTSTRKNAKKFPSDSNEAVAATAVRLWGGDRPVMIFTAQARSVSTMAKAVLAALAFGEDPPPAVHPWPPREWRVFESVCEEELPAGAVELTAARAGVICHSNSLPAQVRIAMEHLMRSAPPRIVIATKTLAQGVNIGVTSVIVSSTRIDKDEYVELHDFLNIAGRAGRAFVDVEGKVLFAIHEGDAKRVRDEEYRAKQYFGGASPNLVVSGVLHIVHALKGIAAKAQIEFAQLLEMAAEDEFGALGENAEDVANRCDLVDDALLSVHEDVLVNGPAEPPEVWVEKLFRESLGALQSAALKTRQNVTPAEVVSFLQARAAAALRRASTPEKRKAVVSSSLPFRVALTMYDELAAWAAMVDEYKLSGESFAALVVLLARAEAWTKKHAASLVDDIPADEVLEAVRDGWLRGVPLRTLCQAGKEPYEACRDYYGFALPWVIHAASQQLRAGGDEARAEVLARLSQFVELGLPSERACRVYLAGIRSRAAAVEIAETQVAIGDSIGEITRKLRNAETELPDLLPQLSEKAASWLALIGNDAATLTTATPKFRRFSLPDAKTYELLVVRSANSRVALTSVDGRWQYPVLSEPDLPFSAVANDPRYSFRFQDGAWQVSVRDPRVPTA